MSAKNVSNITSIEEFLDSPQNTLDDGAFAANRLPQIKFVLVRSVSIEVTQKSSESKAQQNRQHPLITGQSSNLKAPSESQIRMRTLPKPRDSAIKPKDDGFGINLLDWGGRIGESKGRAIGQVCADCVNSSKRVSGCKRRDIKKRPKSTSLATNASQIQAAKLHSGAKQSSGSRHARRSRLALGTPAFSDASIGDFIELRFTRLPVAATLVFALKPAKSESARVAFSENCPADRSQATPSDHGRRESDRVKLGTDLNASASSLSQNGLAWNEPYGSASCPLESVSRDLCAFYSDKSIRNRSLSSAVSSLKTQEELNAELNLVLFSSFPSVPDSNRFRDGSRLFESGAENKRSLASLGRTGTKKSLCSCGIGQNKARFILFDQKSATF